jgi:hypothetical protein
VSRESSSLGGVGGKGGVCSKKKVLAPPGPSIPRISAYAPPTYCYSIPELYVSTPGPCNPSRHRSHPSPFLLCYFLPLPPRARGLSRPSG